MADLDPTRDHDTDLFALKDERAMLHVYQPVELAEPPEWSPFLPVPGVYSHPHYGDLDLRSETYERMISNFKAGVYQEKLPVNAEHDPHASGALGWIVDMRLSDSGALEAKVDWNERGKSLIRDDRYKYVSAEYYFDWSDPINPDTTYQDVAVGLALTTHPYFKERVLPPLVASEAVLTLTGNGKEEHEMADDPKPTPAPEEPVEKVETPPVQEESDQDVTKIEPPIEKVDEETVAQLSERIVAELTTQLGEKPNISDPVVAQLAERTARELAEARIKTREAEASAARLLTENAALRQDNRLKQFSDEVLGQSKANGTAWVGDIADHVKLSVCLAEQFGEDSWELQHWTQTNRSHAEQIKAGYLFRDIGTGRAAEGMNGHEKAEILARTLREQNASLTKEQAYAQVMRDHPEFYD